MIDNTTRHSADNRQRRSLRSFMRSPLPYILASVTLVATPALADPLVPVSQLRQRQIDNSVCLKGEDPLELADRSQLGIGDRRQTLVLT